MVPQTLIVYTVAIPWFIHASTPTHSLESLYFCAHWQTLYSALPWNYNSKVTTSVQCEISRFLIMEHSDNTNFRRLSISEARLSVAVLWALWELPSFTRREAGLHQGTPWHTETLLWLSQFEQRVNTLWFSVCVHVFVKTTYSHNKSKRSPRKLM